MYPDLKKIEYYGRETERKRNIKAYQDKFFKNLRNKTNKGGRRK